MLLWIAEFDRREGWAGPGMLSCAHWLSWRAGMSLATARDQVRVARRLQDLPQLAAAFTDGRVSCSKVRAITRIADPDDHIDWVDLARHSSAAQLDRLVRGVHRARTNAHAARDPQAAAWRLRTRTRYDEQGNVTLTITGPAQLLPVITAGLDAKKQQLQRERTAAAAGGGGTPAPAAPRRVEPGRLRRLVVRAPSDTAADTGTPAAAAETADLDAQAPDGRSAPPDGRSCRR